MVAEVAVIIGSLRKGSLSRCVARSLIACSPETLNAEIVEIGDLPFYNPDWEEQGMKPAAWTTFRERIRESDAVLFVTPEYNRSIPAVLKNAVDVGSRPRRESVWNERPAAIVSASPGAVGGFGANHHLRQVLMCVNAPTMQHPEAYVGGVKAFFDDQGQLTNEATRAFFYEIMSAFARWIALLKEFEVPAE